MMRRTDTVGLLAVLAVLGGLFSVTQVWAAAPAREPVQVVKSGTTVTLYGIVFASPTAGWVVGSGGTILATTNGGTSWKPQKSGSRENLYDVAFPAPRVGWAVGANGTILKTTDGGAKWTAQKSGTIVSLYDVTFLDEKRGWIAGADGTILSTEDGGASWQDRPTRSEEHTSELQSQSNLVCRLLLEKKKKHT